MSTIEESFREGAERPFFSLSCKMAAPLFWAHRVFCYQLVSQLDHAASKVWEIGKRTLMVLSATLALCFAGTHLLLTASLLGAAYKVFHCIGLKLQKNGYTYVAGCPEVPLENGRAKAMVWDIRAGRGGLHYKRGLPSPSSRMEEIISQIRQENPDVLVLQGIDGDAKLVETLIERLKKHYAHLFTYVSGGTMILAKCPMHKFSHTPFTYYDQPLEDGFELFEVKAHPEDPFPCLRLLAAHFPEGGGAAKKRMEGIGQMVQALSREKLSLPTLFAGNVNVDLYRSEEGALLSKYLYLGCQEKEPTYLGHLAGKWDPKKEEPDTVSDCLSLFKRNLPDGSALPVVEREIGLLDSHLVRADANPENILSDHHGVVVTLNGLKGHS